MPSDRRRRFGRTRRALARAHPLQRGTVGDVWHGQRARTGLRQSSGRAATCQCCATETRPLQQGARLTAWELSVAGIPVTLVPDTAAGAVLASGRVDGVIVGCDRVAANGDTANKIGTYSLAVLARENGLPVLRHRSRCRRSTPRRRAGRRSSSRSGPPLRCAGSGRPSPPPSVPVMNPAFDITPAAYISAFITDAGRAAATVRPVHRTGARRSLMLLEAQRRMQLDDAGQPSCWLRVWSSAPPATSACA